MKKALIVAEVLAEHKPRERTVNEIVRQPTLGRNSVERAERQREALAMSLHQLIVKAELVVLGFQRFADRLKKEAFGDQLPPIGEIVDRLDFMPLPELLYVAWSGIGSRVVTHHRLAFDHVWLGDMKLRSRWTDRAEDQKEESRKRDDAPRRLARRWASAS